MTATTLHMSQTANPRCSARIEKARLRRAIRRPVRFQSGASPGAQSSIQRCIVMAAPRSSVLADSDASFLGAGVMFDDSLRKLRSWHRPPVTAAIDDVRPGEIPERQAEHVDQPGV